MRVFASWFVYDSRRFGPYRKTPNEPRFAASPAEPRDALERRAAARSSYRDFAAALKAKRPAIIAEIKKASPSKGVFTDRLRSGGHRAKRTPREARRPLSVLTDEEYFQGSLADLQAARNAVTNPALRKDFTLDEIHVIEAAAHGADAILLIAALLEERELRELRETAERCHMAALVEVHDDAELDAAIGSGARIIGVNNRNLHTFEVTLETSLRLAPRIPAGVDQSKRKAESIQKDADARLGDAGFHAFLVGEHLMRAAEPSKCRAPGAVAMMAVVIMMVKVCGITRRGDAEFAVEAGASALGFVFVASSPRCVTPERAAELAKRICRFSKWAYL